MSLNYKRTLNNSTQIDGSLESFVHRRIKRVGKHGYRYGNNGRIYYGKGAYRKAERHGFAEVRRQQKMVDATFKTR